MYLRITNWATSSIVSIRLVFRAFVVEAEAGFVEEKAHRRRLF